MTPPSASPALLALIAKLKQEAMGTDSDTWSAGYTAGLRYVIRKVEQLALHETPPPAPEEQHAVGCSRIGKPCECQLGGRVTFCFWCRLCRRGTHCAFSFPVPFCCGTRTFLSFKY